MDMLRKLILTALLLPLALAAQVSNPSVVFVTVDPTGSCTATYITQNTSTGTLKGCVSGTWSTIGGGGGGGTVTSVGLTAPTWFSVANSPVTTSGTLAVTAATGQTSHQVVGTCGSATAFSPCALVAADIPTLNQNTTGTAANVTGIVAAANGGTGANNTVGAAGHVLRSNATNYVDSAIQAADVPTLNQNTTGSAGSVAWSGLTNPGGNLALTMGADTSTFTYNSATGSGNMFVLTDGSSNTGTGIIFDVNTASGSSAVPVRFTANSIGYQISATGTFAPTGQTANGAVQLAGATSGSCTLTVPATAGAVVGGSSQECTLGSTTTPFGALVTAGVVSSGTKFTTSGCSISSTTGGATAGKFTLGANSCTAVLTLNGATGLTAPNGWSCWASDQTAPTVLVALASSTTTTASLNIPAGAGATDVISFGCVAY